MTVVSSSQENTIEKREHKANTHSYRKGKYATSTENRRLVWEYIIWPLILRTNKNYFTPEEYHKMRDKVSMKRIFLFQRWLEVWYLFCLKEFSLKIRNTIQFITN